ncbi:hypothetical protein AVEN_85159-1 [Araneus ventricosus]|uniref:Secreted protein n=1 Tax=Araneus ventricosus TaxID=182803 RepID=A0A4Y2LFA9_ARAVE|nr:hypothetical protein AVEN_85159-1 [Araneus ventricosus]
MVKSWLPGLVLDILLSHVETTILGRTKTVVQKIRISTLEPSRFVAETLQLSHRGLLASGSEVSRFENRSRERSAVYVGLVHVNTLTIPAWEIHTFYLIRWSLLQYLLTIVENRAI